MGSPKFILVSYKHSKVRFVHCAELYPRHNVTFHLLWTYTETTNITKIISWKFTASFHWHSCFKIKKQWTSTEITWLQLTFSTQSSLFVRKYRWWRLQSIYQSPLILKGDKFVLRWHLAAGTLSKKRTCFDGGFLKNLKCKTSLEISTLTENQCQIRVQQAHCIQMLLKN